MKKLLLNEDISKIKLYFFRLRCQRNSIWDYFVKSDSNLSKAQCNMCNKLLFLGSDKASVWLKQCLLIYHSEQHRQYLKRQYLFI